MFRPLCAALVGALALTYTLPAAADEPDAATRAAARKIATDGVKALKAGNADVASEKLEKAFELLPAPSVALWSARALVKRGLLVEASERYLQAGRLPPSQGNEQAVQEQAKADAARELAELTPRIPKLVVRVEGAPASEVNATIDGKSISSALIGEEQPSNPGPHQVVGVRGSEQVQQNVTLVEAQRGEVRLVFHAPPPAAAAPPGAAGAGAGAGAGGAGAPTAAAAAPVGALPSMTPSASPQPTSDSGVSSNKGSSSVGKTLGYVALGVGGAGIITGAVTGLMAKSKRAELDDNPACRDGKCLDSVQSEVDGFRTMRTVSTIGFVGGGVLAAAGAVLLFTSGSSAKPAGEKSPGVAFYLSPSSVRLTGAF